MLKRMSAFLCAAMIAFGTVPMWAFADTSGSGDMSSQESSQEESSSAEESSSIDESSSSEESSSSSNTSSEPGFSSDTGSSSTPQNPPPINPVTPPVYTQATVIDLSKGSVAFSGNEVTYYSAPGTKVTENADNKLFNSAYGYVLTGAQGANTITVNGFNAPLVFGTQSAPVSYAADSIDAPKGLTVNGNLTLSGNNSSVSGTVAVTSNVNAGKLSVNGSLSANTLACTGELLFTTGNSAFTGNVSGASVQVRGGTLAVNGTLWSDGPLTFQAAVPSGAAVQAGTIQSVKNNIEVSGTVKANLVSANQGNVNITPSGTLYGRKSAQNSSLAGNVLAGREIAISGRLYADGIVQGSGAVTVYPNASAEAGRLESLGSDLTLAGNAKVSSGTAAKGKLTVNAGVTLSGSSDITAGSFTLNGTVQGRNLTANSALTLDNEVSLTGTLRAPALTVGGNVKAAQANVTGDTYVSGTMNVSGTLASGNTVTVDTRARSGALTAGKIQSKRLSAPYGDLSVPNTQLDTGSSGVDVQGKFRAYGGSVKGQITANTVTLDHSSNVTGKITGKNGITLNDGSAGSLYSNSNVNLKGTLTVGNIDSGPLTIAGNVTAGTVRCTTGVVDPDCKLRADSVSASSSLTVRGTLSSSGKVSGNPVTRPSGGVINASSISGLKDDYKGELTIRTPFGNYKNIYVELRLSGESANGYDVRTDGAGRVTFNGLKPGTYSVYAESGSNARSGSVRVYSSGTSNLDLRSNAGSGGGGGGGGSSNNSFDEDAFWDDVYDSIRSAKRGDTVRVSASKVDRVPVWILEELEDRPITLKLTHGSKTVTIHGDNMYDIPQSRVYYLFDDLYDLYRTQPDRNSSSSSSSSQNSSSQQQQQGSSSNSNWTPPPTANPIQPPPSVPSTTYPVTPPAALNPSGSSDKDGESSSSEDEDSSSEDEESSSMDDEEESSSIDEPIDEPVDKKGINMFPAIIAVAVLLLSIGGVSVGYLIWRQNRDASPDDDDGDDYDE